MFAKNILLVFKTKDMANKRLDMRNILQLLRLYTQGVSKLQISRQLGLSRNTVKKYIELFHQNSFTYQEW